MASSNGYNGPYITLTVSRASRPKSNDISDGISNATNGSNGTNNDVTKRQKILDESNDSSKRLKRDTESATNKSASSGEIIGRGQSVNAGRSQSVNAEKMSNDVDEDEEDMDYEGEAEDDYEEDEEFEGFILICLNGPVHQLSLRSLVECYTS